MDSSQTQKALDSSIEVTITVTGRKTGHQHSTPVWFVRDGKTLFLLPGSGTRSQWYRNALKSKRIKISSGKVSLDLAVTPITNSNHLGPIVEKFRKRCGPTYYSDPKRFEVALSLTLP